MRRAGGRLGRRGPLRCGHRQPIRTRCWWAKEPRFGGASARSGGWLWIFGPSLPKAWGIVETPDQARTYLRHEAGNSLMPIVSMRFWRKARKRRFLHQQNRVHFDMPLTVLDRALYMIKLVIGDLKTYAESRRTNNARAPDADGDRT